MPTYRRRATHAFRSLRCRGQRGGHSVERPGACRVGATPAYKAATVTSQEMTTVGAPWHNCCLTMRWGRRRHGVREHHNALLRPDSRT
jgi:hypothetical protein